MALMTDAVRNFAELRRRQSEKPNRLIRGTVSPPDDEIKGVPALVPASRHGSFLGNKLCLEIATMVQARQRSAYLRLVAADARF